MKSCIFKFFLLALAALYSTVCVVQHRIFFQKTNESIHLTKILNITFTHGHITISRTTIRPKSPIYTYKVLKNRWLF